jgi:hypothetical protein
MKTKVLAIAALLLLTTGCENPNKLSQWHVKLIRPDGQVHRAWFVASATEPKGHPLRGGQIELYYDAGPIQTKPWQYRSAGLVAPVGWIFQCESLDQEFGKSVVEP